MELNNLKKLTEELERQEMEETDENILPEIYEQLLAIYLYENDLCNAKYLWKRISTSIKSSTPELGNIWAVGQQMWKRDFPGIYVALNAYKWSDTVREIMEKVQENVRSRAVDLISQAYSSITLDTVSAMTGLQPDLCLKACIDKNWTIDSDTQIVHPERPTPDSNGQNISEDQFLQLHKLTDFVSFLEN